MQCRRSETANLHPEPVWIRANLALLVAPTCAAPEFRPDGHSSTDTSATARLPCGGTARGLRCRSRKIKGDAAFYGATEGHLSNAFCIFAPAASLKLRSSAVRAGRRQLGYLDRLGPSPDQVLGDPRSILPKRFREQACAPFGLRQKDAFLCNHSHRMLRRLSTLCSKISNRI